jgi:predicted metalloendopeptidase
MTYTIKKKTTKNKNQPECPIGLKPFEQRYTKKISVSQVKKTTSKKKKDLVKELLSKFAPNRIKAQDDFYDYINYQWLQDIGLKKQQKYITQVDDFRLTQDKVYRELNEIILDYIKTHRDKLSKNLNNFYKSVIKMNPQHYTRVLAKQSVTVIDDLIKDNNSWKLLAFFNRDETISYKAPFVWSLNANEKNPKKYASNIDPVQFSILDLSVYYDDGTSKNYKKNYKQQYLHYCKKLFNTLIGSNKYDVNDIFDVQVDIFNALGCMDVTSKEEDTYNQVTSEEALKYGFDWVEFTKYLGYKTTPKHFIVSSFNFLKCMSDLYTKNWNTPKWKTYYVYVLIERLARFTTGWEKLAFDFYGKFERGQEYINHSDAVSSSLYMSVPFNTFLTKQYVKKHENSQALTYVKTLCEDLKIVYRKILMRNDWLAPSTKAYALKKLEKFKFIIGKPAILREDPDLNYGDMLYDNMAKIVNWRHKKQVELDREDLTDIPQMDWGQYPVKMVGTQSYIVNASYTPTDNAIYINLGYIQHPFVDLDERGIEYNLAHIGFTIGHEMSHGFDDWGSKYGWDGNLYDWWTPTDKAKFKLIQNDVIKQYEEFALRDGIKFDASIGIGEDLADISGLAICDEYLSDFQDNNNDLIPIKNLSYNTFYVFFAFQQKQKVNKNALRAQLKANPHPLDKYRCNVPLSRSIIFRALYNVKRGDGMWWHNTNMVW